MMIEFFFAPGCETCGDDRLVLKRMAKALVSDLVWRDVDVLAELDHAVELGVLTLPALAIDGALTFSGLPSERRWRAELCKRVGKEP